MSYQKDQLDQATHTYYYDQLNRLEEVFVSTDKVHQSRQAHYLYYDYGPLARVETGEQKVQGTDYAYTINGWLKAMNGTILSPGYELGRDNASGYLSQNTSVHTKFARDVAGVTLGYFNGDYQSIGSTNFAPSPYSVSTLNTAISQLYNGNIAYTTTAVAQVPSGPAMPIQMGVYRYDQMNRLLSARTFRASGLSASNSWTGAAETQEYSSAYTYDKNGNLKSLLRKGGASSLNMDDFDYYYETIGGKRSNRLDYVDDNTGYTANYTQDIDDQAADNYRYDKLGQLTRDAAEGSMAIEWLAGNRKVKKITRSDKTIEFEYNPFGQRILKKVTLTATGAVTTSYYVYDANGQVMGVYDVNLTGNNASLEELNIYGASRLGMIDKKVVVCTAGTAAAPPVYPSTVPVTHILGYKKYEITNYLGNVNAVITDRKVYVSGTYEAVMIMNSDYYPFGMQMPNRNTNVGDYRFGYNGMELDNEVKGNGNSYTTEFRQYDPRLGRWTSLDPLMMQFPWMSPYVAFDNNPVYYTDPLGLEPGNGDDEKGKSIKGEGGKAAKGIKEVREIEEVLVTAKRTFWMKLRALDRSLKAIQNDNSLTLSQKARASNKAFTNFLHSIGNHKLANSLAVSGGVGVAIQSKLDFLDPRSWTQSIDGTIAEGVKAGELSKRTGMGVFESVIVQGLIDRAEDWKKGDLQDKTEIFASKTIDVVLAVEGGLSVTKGTSAANALEDAGSSGLNKVTGGQKAIDVVEYASKNGGEARAGYKGGRTFANDGRGGGQVLSKVDSKGTNITYKEYDVNPYQKGVNRGSERVVIGSNGKAYYTNNHYRTFTEIKLN